METFFLLCAIIGGTVMLLQFALTVSGIGGHHGDGSDLGSGGGLDAGHDFSGHASGADGYGGGHGDFAGFDPGHHHAAAGSDSADASTHDHGTVWFFKVITFQTLVAALAFFGIAGKAARAADVDPLVALMIAVGAGAAAMYGVYYLIRFLHKFNADGTVRLGRAVGHSGIVYLPVPAANAGTGKIHLNLQNRTVELQAMTSQERLPSGTKVTVIGLIGSDTVQVERLIEAEIPSHV